MTVFAFASNEISFTRLYRLLKLSPVFCSFFVLFFIFLFYSFFLSFSQSTRSSVIVQTRSDNIFLARHKLSPSNSKIFAVNFFYISNR